ncbi:hypothetical protein D3C71_2120510 [compost metagenome]
MRALFVPTAKPRPLSVTRISSPRLSIGDRSNLMRDAFARFALLTKLSTIIEASIGLNLIFKPGCLFSTSI